MAFIILLVLAIVIVSSCAFVVKEKHCYVIEIEEGLRQIA